MHSNKDIDAAKAALQERVSGVPGFAGVGTGEDPPGTPVLYVYLKNPENTAEEIPATVQGYAVRVKPIGPIKAY